MTMNMNEWESVISKAVSKFVNAPRSCTSREALVDGGYMTAEEFALLKRAPRSREMSESGACYPTVGGRVLPEAALNDTERARRTAYVRETRRARRARSEPCPQRVTHGGVVISPEDMERIVRMRAFLNENGASDELKSLFESLLPKRKDNPLRDLFGVEYLGEIASPVSSAWLLFAKKDGTLFEKRDISFIEALREGGRQRSTPSKVLELMDKLNNEGISVEKCVLDIDTLLA